MASSIVEKDAVSLPGQRRPEQQPARPRVGSVPGRRRPEQQPAGPRVRPAPGPNADTRWTADVLGALAAVAVTGLAGTSLMLGLVTCAAWAGLPETGSCRPEATATRAVRLLPRALAVVGLLVVADLAVVTPATAADLAVTVAAAVALSGAVRWVQVVLGRGRAASPCRSLVVHGGEATTASFGLPTSATTGFLDCRDVADPVEAVLARTRQTGTAEVVVLPDVPWSAEQLRRLAWRLEADGVSLSVVTPLYQVPADRVRVRRIGDRLVLHVRPRRLAGAAAVAKSWVERPVAAAALLLLAPLLLAAMAAVRLDSPGAAIFRQVRVGRNGRPFTLYKLRTMYVDAELRREQLEPYNQHADGVLFKIPRDPRITRIGALLRRTSLDELPQLLNVVRGEMSLIGPRPALPAEVARYDDTAARRLVVLPGLTGLWQVSGRSDLSWEESVRLDVQYVESWRPGLDLGIAARTLRAVVGARGAY